MLRVLRLLALPVAALLAVATGCSLVDRIERAIPHPPPRGVDLNTATREEIADLPGVTDADAERIVRNRPYDHKEEVLQRGAVSQETFEKFADRIYVSRSAPSRAASGAPDRSAVARPPA